ncbi:chitin-binding domain-containing protein [Klebsiella pneumoniae]|nr:chitin-binding domain-containing protein [Klebsiella pneumoniae]
MKAFIVLCLVAVACAAPQKAKSGGDEKTASVVREEFDLNPDTGAYKYAFETSNGIAADQSGKQITVGTEQGGASSGSYSYTAPDGSIVKITYVADENGYRPAGDALPKDHPLPDHVVQLLKDLGVSKRA